jgi:4-amino-4-deoxy-L-arabinose transferase-like glycosyltransferase
MILFNGYASRLTTITRAVRPQWIIPCLLIAAFLVRILYNLGFSQLGQPYNHGEVDAIGYDAIAWNLLSGNGYSLDGQNPTAYRSPLFPLLLAATYSFCGHDWISARVMQSLLSAIISVLIFLIGKRLFDNRVALIAAVVSVFYPPLIVSTGSLLTEILYTLLIALAILSLVRLPITGMRNICVSATCVSLAALTRPEGLILLPLLAIWVFRHTRGPKWKHAVAFALVAAVIYSPWIIRNYITFDALIPATTGGGLVLWGAHNPLTFTELSLMGSWVTAARLPHLDEINQLGELSRDQAMFTLAKNTVLEHMARLPLLGIMKLYRLIFEGNFVKDIINVIVICSAGFGLHTAIVRRLPISFLFPPFLAVIVSTLVFYGLFRFRLIVEPYLLLLATYGFCAQVLPFTVSKSSSNQQGSNTTPTEHISQK